MIRFAALALLVLPVFAQAENRFSRQERDWAEQDRLERAARAKASFRRGGPGQFSQVIFNADGSVTVTEPRLVRGPKKLPIEYQYSNKDGVCRLFGLEAHLSETASYADLEYMSMASVNAEGRYSATLSSGYRLESISCANRDAYVQTGVAKRIYENADGSITLVGPGIVRGNRTLPIEYQYSNKAGVCRLFGFDVEISDTASYAELEYVSMASVNAEGRYSAAHGSGYRLKSVTCAMGGDHVETGFAARTERNLDGSVTLYDPMLIRGMSELRLEYQYSNKVGICRLFGFRNQLEDSVEYGELEYDSMASINSEGRYSATHGTGYPVKSVTCYNGRYKTTAIAGGFIFQDGEWMGKVRRSRSRWLRPEPPVAAPLRP